MKKIKINSFLCRSNATVRRLIDRNNYKLFGYYYTHMHYTVRDNMLFE